MEYLSPPSSTRRRSSVMFNEYVILHTPPTINDAQANNKNVCLSEKTTQTSDGNIWKVNTSLTAHSVNQMLTIFSPFN